MAPGKHASVAAMERVREIALFGAGQQEVGKIAKLGRQAGLSVHEGAYRVMACILVHLGEGYPMLITAPLVEMSEPLTDDLGQRQRRLKAEILVCIRLMRPFHVPPFALAPEARHLTINEDRHGRVDRAGAIPIRRNEDVTYGNDERPLIGLETGKLHLIERHLL